VSYYDERLANDKAKIRQRVVAIGRRVEQRIGEAVSALIERDVDKCYAIVLGDLPINRESRAIDRACHAFVARHLPSAGHLRFVSSVLQMNVALERVGDYAVTIAREGVQLRAPVQLELAGELKELSKRACEAMHQSVTAFERGDAELARKTRSEARKTEQRHGEVIRQLAEAPAGTTLWDALALLMVFNRIGRVSDQARNICEETVFEVTGEMKPAKRYSILFVDDDASLAAPLAVALAYKAFPESGSYRAASAGAPGGFSPKLKSLAGEFALDLTRVEPAEVDTKRDSLEQYHVVVALSGDARSRLEAHMPYATVLLQWQVAEHSGNGARDLVQYLSGEIQSLMVTMRGDDAA
jgi:phosphate transport system protein